MTEIQLQLESTMNSLKLNEEKFKRCEDENKLLKASLNLELQKNFETSNQLQHIEKMRDEYIKSLKEETSLTYKLQNDIEILKLDRERDATQYEEKLRRINSSSGESKQNLIATEMKLSEITTQLYQHKSAKEELSLTLQNAEEKCDQMTSEVKRLKEKVFFIILIILLLLLLFLFYF